MRATAMIVGARLDVASALTLALDEPLGGLLVTGIVSLLYVIVIGLVLWLGLRYLTERQLSELERRMDDLQKDTEFMKEESSFLTAHRGQLGQDLTTWRESGYRSLPPLLQRYITLEASTRSLEGRLRALDTGQWSTLRLDPRLLVSGEAPSLAVIAIGLTGLVANLALLLFIPAWPLNILYFPVGFYAAGTIPRLVRIGAGLPWVRILPHVLVLMIASATVAGVGGMYSPDTTAIYTFTAAGQRVLPDGFYAAIGATGTGTILATCGPRPRIVVMSQGDIVGARIAMPSQRLGPPVSLFGVIMSRETVPWGLSDIC